MIQSVVYNPIQNSQQYYSPTQYLNELTSQNLNDIRARYYPDLAQDEFGLDTKTQNELLYKRNKLQQLAKYGTYINCEATYNKIKDNQDFKELISSKYLNNAQGFLHLVSSMADLEQQRATKFIQPYLHNANIIYAQPINYKKYNVNDYLQLLNNFVKNPKISDDLKQYFLAMKMDKLDVYYTRLDKLNTNLDPMEILTADIPYSKE